MYVPFTGLGKFNGFRGKGWLRNRIRIFKHFVVPSLLAQTNQNFTVWVSWRPEERMNKDVHELMEWLEHRLAPTVLNPVRVVATYGGVCFWDDKYPDEEANERLANAIHRSLPPLMDLPGEAENIIMTIQPSDDCYRRDAVQMIKDAFDTSNAQAFGFKRGLIMRYATGEIAEYNPLTIPPFFSIKFPKSVFIRPVDHIAYTGPYKSHEYIADKLRFLPSEERGFLVGTHGENISTVFDHPFKGADRPRGELWNFGLDQVPPLSTNRGIRRRILNAMPYRIRRKVRFWCSEKIPALSFLVQ